MELRVTWTVDSEIVPSVNIEGSFQRDSTRAVDASAANLQWIVYLKASTEAHPGLPAGEVTPVHAHID
jgi:hypothetical protein